MQMKGVDDKLRRVVLGAVVYNNDLIGVIVQSQQRADGLGNGHFFIVGRNNDTDGNVVIVMDGIVQLALFDVRKQLIAAHDHGSKQEGGIPCQVEDKEDFRNFQNLLYRFHGEGAAKKV